MKLKRELLWIILFGSLIGLNETLLGGMHIPYKSVILSVITLLLLSIGRYLIPRIGTSLLMIAVAVLFKMTDLGIHGCKVEGMVMLGVTFEAFASLMIRKESMKFYFFSIVSLFAALCAFYLFALMQRYVLHNEFWDSQKFGEHVFVKGPFTAVASALVTLFGVLLVQPVTSWYYTLVAKSSGAVYGILSLLIVVFWLLGYITA